MWTFGRLDTTIAQQLVDLLINDGLHSGVLRVEPFYGLFVSHDDVVLRDTGYPFEVVKSTQLKLEEGSHPWIFCSRTTSRILCGTNGGQDPFRCVYCRMVVTEGLLVRTVR